MLFHRTLWRTRYEIDYKYSYSIFIGICAFVIQKLLYISKAYYILRYKNDTKIEQLSDIHLKEWPIFRVFNRSFFEQHYLPAGPISYRYNPDKAVTGTVLSELLGELL